MAEGDGVLESVVFRNGGGGGGWRRGGRFLKETVQLLREGVPIPAVVRSGVVGGRLTESYGN